ncbi:unnamed protein product [Pleuronectes platessa]|uniref:Uncharacterized protein n=1 Tax=Pleuronectes platessa TaxID=8262 RepID=A0A9N7ZBC2_PLEPL|nr:unnamed protein product [Pleuronectes platessa]
MAGEILADSPLTDRQGDQSKVNDGEGGRRKKDGGARDNNRMNDRIQVFGFARQTTSQLPPLPPGQSMISDFSTIIGHQSREARRNASAWSGGMVTRRGGGGGGGGGGQGMPHNEVVKALTNVETAAMIVVGVVGCPSGLGSLKTIFDECKRRL